jgi:hypothetical protein
MAIEWKKIAFVENSAAQSVLGNPTGSAAVASAITVAEQTLVGRITGGNVDDLSVAQVQTMLGIGSGSSLDVHQDGHSFVVGDELYLDGAVYKKADCTTEATAEVVGKVSEVAGVDDFTIQTSGWMNGLTGLTAGAVYFLSATAGAMTVTAPTTEGYVDKPVFLADTTTSGFVLSMRGVVIAASAVSDTAFGTSWNGETETAPSKNAVYDGIESLIGDGIRRNYIINGNFDIWQRGTSQETSGYGSADRWSCGHANTSAKTASQVAFTTGQTDVPDEPTYFMRHAVTTSSQAAEYCVLQQRIESVRTLAGKTAILSFYAKANAAKNISLEFIQDFGTGGSPSAGVEGIGVQKIAITTSWARYTATVTIPSISGKTVGTDNNSYIVVQFFFTAGSDFNARTDSLGNQTGDFDIAKVSLIEGSLDVAPTPRSFAEELALCQRYYQRFNCSAGWNRVGNGIIVQGSIGAIIIELMCAMRAVPSFGSYGAWWGRNGTISGQMVVDTSASDNQRLGINFSIAGSEGAATQVLAFGDTTAYYYASAEL